MSSNNANILEFSLLASTIYWHIMINDDDRQHANTVALS